MSASPITVPWNFYLTEWVLLGIAVILPVIVWIASGDPVMTSRFGSLTVLLSAIVEFRMIRAANRKHLLNVQRSTPLEFSSQAPWVERCALAVAALGTVLWGFGDVILPG